MANKPAKPKWSPAQVKEHTRRIQEVVEQQKRQIKKGEAFTAVTPEDIERKLKRVHSPMIVAQSWNSSIAPGATVPYGVTIYNPDPTQAIWLFTHVWVGSGNVDPSTGTFLLNVDSRFPRLTNPVFAGQTLAPGASITLNFSLSIPANIEKTSYLGNSCLMQFNWHDIGQYLDRGVFVFTVV
jgi:hypothetical protein